MLNFIFFCALPTMQTAPTMPADSFINLSNIAAKFSMVFESSLLLLIYVCLAFKVKNYNYVHDGN